MEEIQFETGQHVVYGNSGVCIVEDIKLMRMTMDMPKEMYYILHQKKNPDSKIFVPLKNEKLTSRIRSVMEKADIEDLLMGMRDSEVTWNSDRRARADSFHRILQEGVSLDLISMIICIYEQKRKLARAGKKLPSTDASTLRSAEKLVEEEFAYVLDVDKSEVGKYIRKRLHIPEEEEYEIL